MLQGTGGFLGGLRPVPYHWHFALPRNSSVAKGSSSQPEAEGGMASTASGLPCWDMVASGHCSSLEGCCEAGGPAPSDPSRLLSKAPGRVTWWLITARYGNVYLYIY